VEITLIKRIPVAGGLGGGSSDAAAVLMGLDGLWRLGLGPAGLLPLARRLGADVPYFLIGGTALGLARGDEVYPLWRQVRGEVVIVDGGCPLSTAAVFQRLDASLTPRDGTNRIFRFISSDLAGHGTAFPILSNDLERPALEEAPDLAARVDLIRGILIREGALMASLSGSGASYFGLFDDPERARKAQSRLVARGVKALRGRTLSFDQYRRLWAQPARVRARSLDQGRSGQHGDH
jgi:4-diphosphocytidyl-2-C-methyl-D-erythritol kinase